MSAWWWILLIGSLIGLAASLPFVVTRWGRAKLNSIGEPNKAPHEKWPQILDWRKGDHFEGLFPDVWQRHSQGNLVTIQPDGYAILDFMGEREWLPIKKLIGHNISLRTRRVDADLQASDEYMELLNEFHKAVDELKRRDKQNGIAA